MKRNIATASAGVPWEINRQRHAGRFESAVANDEQPDPTMEQAFIQLIHDGIRSMAMSNPILSWRRVRALASKRRGRSFAIRVAG